MNTADYLSARQCAALAQVKLPTWWGYVNRGQAPPADVRWLNRDLWHRDTFGPWLTSRDARKAARRRFMCPCHDGPNAPDGTCVCGHVPADHDAHGWCTVVVTS